MRDNILITEKELLLTENSLAGKAKALLVQQKRVWELLRKGYESLDLVEVRTFDFGQYKIKVQFNPGRITSSAAKVDNKSIKERRCFLCNGNLPAEQRGILSEDDYLILCNPFPIFNEHFTIPHLKHVPQEIQSSFGKFLRFTQDLGRYYTVFYNGPKCGASAPDHLHFQAGNKYFMPLEMEYDTIKETLGEKIIEGKSLKVYAVDKYPGKFFSFESADHGVLKESFEAFYQVLKEKADSAEEPMMNILSSYQNGAWRVIVVPRAEHRPSCYFAEGEDNILLSPASVDMGGVLITPLEKDFRKITKDNIIDIFRQVTLPDEQFGRIKESLFSRIRIQE